MRIEVGQERTEIDIDISDIIQEGGNLNILPQVKNYFSIDYKPKKNKLSLVAKGYIGLIPITADLAIDIRPKFSINNLARIVSISQGKFKSISYFSKYYNEQPDASKVVSEFLLDSFIIELEKLYSEGVFREYLAKTEYSSFIKGKLNIADSIKKLWSHGHFNKASVKYYELSPETPLNKLIKYTIEYCLTLLHQEFLTPSIQTKLIYFHQGFSNFEINPSDDFLKDAFELIKGNKIPELRHYYINICEICRLLLTGSGIDFDNHGTMLNISSFIINMESVFEKFLLNSIKNRKALLGDNYIILDGNDEGKKKFFKPPGRGRGDAKPDIIIKVNNKTTIIADAKYKFKSKDSDRYQVISHALSYEAKVAVLIMPTNDSGTRVVELGGVGGVFEIRVYEVFVDISSNDLEAEEIKLMSILKSFIDTEVT
ncbi:restriction endonuclease [Photobacterium carnosum]|uniref:McrC family protein n=1 Tax=Photobacterium carnosum TaxID=2023717 RepID=UPI001E4CB336|nr:restriction endonuclease [Photobacterium carnosum]